MPSRRELHACHYSASLPTILCQVGASWNSVLLHDLDGPANTTRTSTNTSNTSIPPPAPGYPHQPADWLHYLLLDDAPRRPFRSAEDNLGERLANLDELEGDDLELVPRFIDALVTKTRLKNLAAEAS